MNNSCEAGPRRPRATAEIIELVKSKKDFSWRDIQKIVGRYFPRKFYKGEAFLYAVNSIAKRAEEIAEKNKEEAVKREIEKKRVTYEQRLRDSTRYDALTGVFNHGYVEEELPKFIRKNPRCSILMIDIDHFKSVNDTHGHLTGDEVLSKLGEQFEEIFPLIPEGEALVGRWGGEEFIVVLPGEVRYDDISKDERMERLRSGFKQFAEDSGLLIEDAFQGTVSIGIFNANFSDSSLTINGAILRADKEALYAAKQTRNTVKIWEPPK